MEPFEAVLSLADVDVKPDAVRNLGAMMLDRFAAVFAVLLVGADFGIPTTLALLATTMLFRLAADVVEAPVTVELRLRPVVGSFSAVPTVL
jgi:hypothetical protein